MICWYHCIIVFLNTFLSSIVHNANIAMYFTTILPFEHCYMNGVRWFVNLLARPSMGDLSVNSSSVVIGCNDPKT